jgi:hypothetical protein
MRALALEATVGPTAKAGDLAAAAAALLVLLALRPGRMPEPPVVAVAHPPAPKEMPVAPVTPKAVTAVRTPRPKPEPAEPLVVKLITDDPNVVIYWIAN